MSDNESTKAPTKKELEAEEIERCKAILLEHLKPGDTVRTILRSVSRSGMSRQISVIIMRDGMAWDASYFVGKVAGYKQARNSEALSVGGCGMDMGFSVVYSLSRSLFPNGFNCIGKGCPANDHSNDWGQGNRDETLNYHPSRIHTDGGYALGQRWL